MKLLLSDFRACAWPQLLPVFIGLPSLSASCTSTQQALIGMADDSKITIRCACGVPEVSLWYVHGMVTYYAVLLQVDGLMIGCDACDGWEHLSCRGLLKAPPEEEAHTCHGCLKTNNPDLKVCVIGNNIHNTISICTDVMLEKEGT